jgi:O-antigen ligase
MIVWIGLAACLMLAAALVGLRRAFFCLMLLRPACDRVFEMLRAGLGSANGPGFSLNILVLGLAALAVVRRPKVIAAPAVLGWLSFVAAAAASTLLAPDPGHALRLLLTLATYGAVLIITHVLVKDRASAAMALSACILSSLVPALVGLAELARDPSILGSDGRLFSTFMHPNILAFYLVTVFAAILFVLSSTMFTVTPALRLALLGWAGILLVLLLATKTRSAWIALALILAVQAIFIDRRWLWLLLLLPLALLIPGIGGRLLDLSDGNTADAFAQLNSLAWRQILWRNTYDWLASNPPGLFGHGLDHYPRYVPVFFDQAGRPSDEIGTHNALLQIYFETGILGSLTFAMAFVAIGIVLLGRLAHDFHGTLIAGALCLGFLACAYSDNVLDYLQFLWPFWLFMGVTCSSAQFLAAESAWAGKHGKARSIRRLRLRPAP